MTKREFLEQVITETQNIELRAFAMKEIEKLNERNAKRSSTETKTQIENKEHKVKILDFLKGKDFTSASAIGLGCEISTNKASALCRQLVEDNQLIVTEIKSEKKGKVKGYKLVEQTDEE